MLSRLIATIPRRSRGGILKILLGQATAPQSEESAEPEPTPPPKVAELAPVAGSKGLPARAAGSVLIGLDPDKRPVWWRIDELPNAFMATFGSSGSGKSVFLRAVAASAQLPVLVIDFHGDLKGRGVTTTPGTVADLNPLEVVSSRGPADQAALFTNSVVRAVPALRHVQRSRLREAVTAAYSQAGITEDPQTWQREAPDIKALRALIKKAATDASASGLDAAVDNLFTGHAGQRLRLRELLRTGGRINLSALSRPAQVLAAETLLEQLWGALRTSGPVTGKRYRVMLVIDEAVILRGCAVLDTLIREARKFGLALVLAAQASSEVSSAILNNAAAVLQLQLGDPSEARAAARMLRGVEPQQLLSVSKPGDGFLRLPGSVTEVHVLPQEAPERRALLRSEGNR